MLLTTLSGLVVVGAVAAAGVAVAMPDGVDGPGAMLAELQGHRQTAAYETTADTPHELVPAWAADGTDVISVRPGDGAPGDRGNRRVEMTWAGTLPDCTDMPEAGMPWDGGGSNWPDYPYSDAQMCEGWITIVQDGHLYAWTDDVLLEGA
ncbi:hypothetical protein BD833_105216 [Blastococcus xanthinilyticus]|uniref:Uncharacterized protein n=1 Tax=Blastococcus xanthinilyticus TaxID=1564164 RepID=A0A5S5CW76_9ACTN|nr:hypothetical protein BD833_105216 [Blastococcus xanthinilyticus]